MSQEAISKYVALYKEMQEEQKLPVRERKRPTEDFMKELDDLYMGKMTVWDRAEAMKLLGKNPMGIF